MKIPNHVLRDLVQELSLARIVSEDSQRTDIALAWMNKSSKDS